MYQKRFDTLLNFIKAKGNVKIKELNALFPEYNEMTIRRDLITLEKIGYIVRTHGGAKINEEILSPKFSHSKRIITYREEKERIGKCALEFIKKNSSIYLDSGSTVLQMVKNFPDIPIFVLTNSPLFAWELATKKNVEVVLTGGSLNKQVFSLSGPIAQYSLDRINIDLAFFGAAGYSDTHGFTNALYNECELKKKAFSVAKEKIMLIDSSKDGKILPYTFAEYKDINTLITDKEPSKQQAESLNKNGVNVIIAK